MSAVNRYSTKQAHYFTATRPYSITSRAPFAALDLSDPNLTMDKHIHEVLV